ncbi:hypothetical protein BC830DRAFT_1078348 [Chytriomyces sp. MP71]|nr:hypothetical protein BC830DRAFT_1078348 [Chytriomyces sp. MP71]
MGLVYSLLQRPATKANDAVRIGILGAANIAPVACTNPLKHLKSGVASAVCARDETKAAKFAKRNGVPRVLPTYEALTLDPDIDAVYIPSPNGLHAKHALMAIRAGKHVLCEKPLSANKAQALAIKTALDDYNASHPQRSLIFAEAFHWKCHPVAKYLKSVLLGQVAGWNLGNVERVDVNMIMPGKVFIPHNDIRLNFELAGGSLMDLSYAVSGSRFVVEQDALRRKAVESVGTGATDLGALRDKWRKDLLAQTVPRVESTTVKKWDKDERIDVDTVAHLTYPGGIKSTIHAALHGNTLDLSITVYGSRGVFKVTNHVMPFLWHSISLKERHGQTKYTTAYSESEYTGIQTTYWYQMKAFLEAVEGKGSFYESGLTDIHDAVTNMEVIDSVYDAAQMPLRQ